MRTRLARPLFVAAASAALAGVVAAPAQAHPPAPAPSEAAPAGHSAGAVVEIPGYGPYPLSPDLVPATDAPAPADPQALLAAAAFSADYERNAAARDAALAALGPERRAQAEAGLAALHSPVVPPAAAHPWAPIVVLGNGLNEDGSVQPNLANRLVAAEELARQRPEAPIVVSGGPAGNGHVEAHAMRDWLNGRGMPAERVLIEDRAYSTVSNAEFSRRLVPQADAAVVVSSQDHVHRAVVDFTLAFGPGVTVAGVGAANVPPAGDPGTTGIYRDVVSGYLG